MMIFFALFLLLETLAVFLERQAAISSKLEKLEKFIKKQEVNEPVS